jgi:predicted ATPase
MKLQSIVLENFRSFKNEVTIDALSDVNVFIGANNAGKSNILEALRNIQALTNGELLKHYPELVFDGNEKSNIRISLRLIPSHEERIEFIKPLFQKNLDTNTDRIFATRFFSEILLEFIFDSKGLLKESIKIGNIIDGLLPIVSNSRKDNSLETERLGLQKKCKNLIKFENLDSVTNIRSQWGQVKPWAILNVQGIDPPPVENQLLLYIREYIKKWFWFSPIRNPTSHMPLGEEAILDSSGTKLVKVLFTLQNNYSTRRSIIEKEFVRIIPEMESFRAQLRGDKSVVTIGENNLTSKRDLENVSSGLTQSLTLTTGIINSHDISMLMIEEPEIHLHATAQRRLFDLIKRTAEDKQFFLTTHSTIFSSCEDRTGTYLVTKRSGTTNVKKIQELKEMKLIKDCLGHRNSDLFGDECVVFVEGDSEELAFPIIAKALGIDFRTEGIRLINLKGRDKATQLHEYLRYLKDSDVITYVILDGCERTRAQLTDWEKEGLIESGNWVVWDLEFEDCFDLKIIAQAINEMFKEQGVELNVSVQQLRENKGEASVVRVLEKILHDRELTLDKPELAERIGSLVSEDIGKEGHNETLLEIEIRKIMKLAQRGKSEIFKETSARISSTVKKTTNPLLPDISLITKLNIGEAFLDKLYEETQKEAIAIYSDAELTRFEIQVLPYHESGPCVYIYLRFYSRQKNRICSFRNLDSNNKFEHLKPDKRPISLQNTEGLNFLPWKKYPNWIECIRIAREKIVEPLSQNEMTGYYVFYSQPDAWRILFEEGSSGDTYPFSWDGTEFGENHLIQLPTR